MSAIWTFYPECHGDTKYAACNMRKTKFSLGGNSAKTFGTFKVIHHLRTHHTAEYTLLSSDIKISTQECYLILAMLAMETWRGTVNIACSLHLTTSTIGEQYK